MSWQATVILAFGAITLLSLSGLPVFAAFLILNVFGVLIFLGAPAFGLFANSLVSTLLSEPFVTIPLYLLIGEILSRSGAMEDLYDALNVLVARTRLKLYVMAIAMATCLGAVSGSAMADAALLSRTLYPGMIARGYDRRISAGLIMAGATLAPIIPPSVLVVLIGTLAGVSISKLLVAGIIPGLMLALLFYVYIRVRVFFDPSKAPAMIPDAQAPSWRQRFWAILRLVPIIIILFAIMGPMLLGIATPTESAATGVLGAAILALARKRFGMRIALGSMRSAAQTTTILMLIIMSANLFGQLLAYTRAPDEMVEFVQTLSIGPTGILVMLLVVAFFACMFLGQAEFMLISIPIYGPIIATIGLDPVWFWTLYLVTITVAAMTPPFGVTMFVFQASARNISTIDVYNATWPFVLVILFGLALMAAFPQIVLWVPGLMG